MPWGAAIAAVGVIGGAAIQSSAASKAAKQQRDATQLGIDEQARQYDQTREDLAPWRDTGAQAVHRLGDLIQPGAQLGRSFTMEDFLNDPVTKASFQFGLDEGRKGIERRGPLTSGFDSGATLKALTRFGTDYGGQRAGESFNRFQTEGTNQFNRLASVAGLGQTSAGQTAALGQATGTNISNMLMNQGDASGATTLARGNVGARALAGTSQTIGNWWAERDALERDRRLRQPDFSDGYY
jgi:hypothetical protein